MELQVPSLQEHVKKTLQNDYSNAVQKMWHDYSETMCW